MWCAIGLRCVGFSQTKPIVHAADKVSIVVAQRSMCEGADCYACAGRQCNQQEVISNPGDDVIPLCAEHQSAPAHVSLPQRTHHLPAESAGNRSLMCVSVCTWRSFVLKLLDAQTNFKLGGLLGKVCEAVWHHRCSNCQVTSDLPRLSL